jgi:hypothetical protein
VVVGAKSLDRIVPDNRAFPLFEDEGTLKNYGEPRLAGRTNPDLPELSPINVDVATRFHMVHEGFATRRHAPTVRRGQRAP